jgi:hypothetical protein
VKEPFPGAKDKTGVLLTLSLFDAATSETLALEASSRRAADDDFLQSNRKRAGEQHAKRAARTIGVSKTSRPD